MDQTEESKEDDYGCLASTSKAVAPHTRLAGRGEASNEQAKNTTGGAEAKIEGEACGDRHNKDLQSYTKPQTAFSGQRTQQQRRIWRGKPTKNQHAAEPTSREQSSNPVRRPITDEEKNVIITNQPYIPLKRLV